jgi:hypothetical protein
VIGDGILFHLEENKFSFVGRAVGQLIQFHAETGGSNVTTKKDDRSPGNPKGQAVTRNFYRYQIQGPNAQQVIEKLNGGPFETIKFFHMGYIKIADDKSAPCVTAWPERLGWKSGDPTLNARDPQCDCRSRQGFRLGPGRQPRLRDQHPGIGMDSVSTSGCLHRRQDEILPAVAPGRELRRHRLHRRKLLLTTSKTTT